MLWVVPVPQSPNGVGGYGYGTAVYSGDETVGERTLIAVGNEVAANPMLEGFSEATACAGDCRHPVGNRFDCRKPQRLCPYRRSYQSPGTGESNFYFGERDPSVEPDGITNPELTGKGIEYWSTCPVSQDP